MFLLDTNVLSAMLAVHLPPAVAAWMAGTPERFLYTAAICQAELLAGIAVLPEGRRRRDLADAAFAMLVENRAGLEYVPAERLYPCTNCGMAPLDQALAYKKLEALSAGAALVRGRV
jgi:hypothetical protein